MKNGEYRARWHNYSEPDKVFSSWYDQLAAEETPPIAALARARLGGAPPKTGAELAEQLYTYSLIEGNLVSACNETVAIAMPASTGGQQ